MPYIMASPPTVPNPNRIRLRPPKFEQYEEGGNTLYYMTVKVDVFALVNAQPFLYDTYDLEIRNGECRGLRRVAAPRNYRDLFETFIPDLPLATGFDNARVAWNTGNNMMAQLNNLEDHLRQVSVGLLPP